MKKKNSQPVSHTTNSGFWGGRSPEDYNKALKCCTKQFKFCHNFFVSTVYFGKLIMFFHTMQVIFGNAPYCHAVLTWAINLLPVVVLLHILGGLQESWGWSSPLNRPGMRVSFACLSFPMKRGHLYLLCFIAWACINLNKLHIDLYKLHIDILILHQVIFWVFVIAS